MTEHRLIERMLKLMQEARTRAEATRSIDPGFVDAATDFIRVYADRTHHGKEEDILFRDLSKKILSPPDLKVMNELIEEHVFGRKATGSLAEANSRYRNGDRSALIDVISGLRTICDFYPVHIEKEDKVFFPAALTYVTGEEDQAMLSEFREFDRNMIHEKYASVVRDWGGNG